ncbi:hypothetical protein ACQ4PT_014895 [Festuca glaucescens]
MPRGERRSGVMYIDNDKERDITLFKRRGGLYKGAADLSVLTGAKVAIVLERDTGKMHSFGAPAAKPIVDAFLSGHPPTTPFSNGVATLRIARLQGDVARLDMENMKAGKRNQLSIQHMKEVQDENPGMEAKLLFSKEEDLSLEDLDRLFSSLSRVQDDIKRRLSPIHNGCRANTSGPSMTQNLQPPRGPLSDLLNYATSPMLSPWSHHLPQHKFPSFPLPYPLEQLLAPLHHIQVPQMLQPPPSFFVPQPVSLLQSIPDSLHELTPPYDLHLQNRQSSYKMVQPPQNYASHNSTTEHSFEATPPLLNCSIDDFFIDDMFGSDQWGYPLSDQACNNGLHGMDSYLGYNGINVGQSSMGNGGQINPSLASSSSRQDVDIQTQYGGFF